MPRALLLVLDSLGCGGAPDAADFGDAGADTLGHIAQACADGRGDRDGLRSGALRIPHLDALGLGLACERSTGALPPGFTRAVRRDAIYGCAIETALGKDTPSGHWEIAGAPFIGRLGLFPATTPCFPRELVEALVREARLPGVIGDKHAAGVAIVEELGEEHLRTGKPIVYTSADSVIQIAAHEDAFGLERLYETCRIARRIANRWNVGRVIARPFVGTGRADFRRTPRRKDFPIPPPPGNLLDRAAEAGRAVLSFGKIGDIFGHRATGEEVKGASNDALIDLVCARMPTLPDGGLAFANLVDLDTDFGHRRDVAGYAAGLEAFDRRTPEIEATLRDGDLLIVTADHGNDPTWRGTDHTRENVPIVGFVRGRRGGDVGRRASFADIGQTVARHLGLAAPAAGAACDFRD
ncbi:MAG: phosphopentomutase [Hyphomicrobiales bacterium]|nr:phosphopentomutase [Hyphomicrobiales bacterium]